MRVVGGAALDREDLGVLDLAVADLDGSFMVGSWSHAVVPFIRVRR
jgi:hypothetical protein